jgi:hypothetical protein
MRRVAKKRLTKKQKQMHREADAFRAAAQATIVMCIEKMPVLIRAQPDDSCFYDISYKCADLRLEAVAIVGQLAVERMRDKREVESDAIYEDFLAIPDPYCFLDRVTEDEVRNMITLALFTLTQNWYVVESIADKLLALAQEQTTVISLAPPQYNFSK